MSTIRGMNVACLCCVLMLAAGPRAAALTVTAAPDASRLERLAAAEVQRYVYLRTGIVRRRIAGGRCRRRRRCGPQGPARWWPSRAWRRKPRSWRRRNFC